MLKELGQGRRGNGGSTAVQPDAAAAVREEEGGKTGAVVKAGLEGGVVSEDTDGDGLTMHIGIGAGSMTYAVLGGVNRRCELIFDGPGMLQMAQAEGCAKTGECVVSNSVWELVQDYEKAHPWNRGQRNRGGRGGDVGNMFTCQALADSEEHKDGFVLITSELDTSRWPALPAGCRVPDPNTALKEGVSTHDLVTYVNILCPLLHAFVPAPAFKSSHRRASMAGAITAGVRKNELRVVTVIFMQLHGIESNNGEDLLVLHPALVAMQQDLQRNNGMLRQFIVDDKGCVLIACFGTPQHTHHDDPKRAIKSALAMLRSLGVLDLTASVGITTGKAFCCCVGSTQRREYAVVGGKLTCSRAVRGGLHRKCVCVCACVCVT